MGCTGRFRRMRVASIRNQAVPLRHSTTFSLRHSTTFLASGGEGGRGLPVSGLQAEGSGLTVFTAQDVFQAEGGCLGGGLGTLG